MLVRLLAVLILCTPIGCESFSTHHRAVEETVPHTSPARLMSLSKVQGTEGPALHDRRGIPNAEQPEAGQMKPSSNGSPEGGKPVDPFPTVYFPFDSWEIHPEVQERLDATAAWLGRFPNYELTIEGHADIRGTQSYNMVLGAKRAIAVKEYLSNLGIPPTRLEIVSFGNTMLLCEVDDEQQCHQYNRRADLLLD